MAVTSSVVFSLVLTVCPSDTSGICHVTELARLFTGESSCQLLHNELEGKLLRSLESEGLARLQCVKAASQAPGTKATVFRSDLGIPSYKKGVQP